MKKNRGGSGGKYEEKNGQVGQLVVAVWVNRLSVVTSSATPALWCGGGPCHAEFYLLFLPAAYTGRSPG